VGIQDRVSSESILRVMWQTANGHGCGFRGRTRAKAEAGHIKYLPRPPLPPQHHRPPSSHSPRANHVKSAIALGPANRFHHLQGAANPRACSARHLHPLGPLYTHICTSATDSCGICIRANSTPFDSIRRLRSCNHFAVRGTLAVLTTRPTASRPSQTRVSPKSPRSI
jgi:hypothetical protein